MKIAYTHEMINNHAYILQSCLYDRFKKQYQEDLKYIESYININDERDEIKKQYYRDITAERLNAQNELLYVAQVITYNQYQFWRHKIMHNIKFNERQSH